MKAPSERYEGMWDFDGACAPPESGDAKPVYFETFTLGCFQWLKRSSGAGLKKGRVQYRVKGQTSDPHPAYVEAREFCRRNNGEAA